MTGAGTQAAFGVAPVISVAIPTFQRPAFLREAVASALDQRGAPPYEVVVVDNDPAGSAAQALRDLDSPCLVVHTNDTNIGMWRNLQRCLEVVRGRWVVFLCDDDLLVPGALGRFADFARREELHGAGAIAGSTQLVVDVSVRPLRADRHPVRHPLSKDASSGGAVRLDESRRWSDVPKLCSTFFDAESLRASGGWSDLYAGFGDVEVFLRFARRGRLWWVPHVFGCFRVHADNGSHPERVWSTYPAHAAARLLDSCLGATTPLDGGIRRMVERKYVTALWKGRFGPGERKALAQEVRPLLRSPARRLLLRVPGGLASIAWAYHAVRPALVRLFAWKYRRGGGSASG